MNTPIKVEELRIGNIVRSSEGWLAVIESISSKKFSEDNETEQFFFSCKESGDNFRTDSKVYPDKLTYDMLNRLKFKNIQDNWWLFNPGNLNIYIMEHEGIFVYKVACDKSVLNGVGIRYTHELQNLMFSVFKINLNIKL